LFRPFIALSENPPVPLRPAEAKVKTLHMVRRPRCRIGGAVAGADESGPPPGISARPGKGRAGVSRITVEKIAGAMAGHPAAGGLTG
jgi:hypothetical protein